MCFIMCAIPSCTYSFIKSWFFTLVWEAAFKCKNLLEIYPLVFAPPSFRWLKVVCGFSVDCICSAAVIWAEKGYIVRALSSYCSLQLVANIATICPIQPLFAPTLSFHRANPLRYICACIVVAISHFVHVFTLVAGPHSLIPILTMESPSRPSQSN